MSPKRTTGTGEDYMEDRIVLSKIREMLENRLEGVKIENFSQILDILHALIDDYSKI